MAKNDDRLSKLTCFVILLIIQRIEISWWTITVIASSKKWNPWMRCSQCLFVLFFICVIASQTFDTIKGSDSTRNKRRSLLLENKRSNQDKRGLYLVLKKTIYMYTRVIIVIIKLLVLFRFQCQCSFLMCFFVLFYFKLREVNALERCVIFDRKLKRIICW